MLFAAVAMLVGLSQFYLTGDEQPSGPLNPLVAYVIYGFIVNTLYLCGAVALGVASRFLLKNAEPETLVDGVRVVTRRWVTLTSLTARRRCCASLLRD